MHIQYHEAFDQPPSRLQKCAPGDVINLWHGRIQSLAKDIIQAEGTHLETMLQQAECELEQLNKAILDGLCEALVLRGCRAAFPAIAETERIMELGPLDAPGDEEGHGSQGHEQVDEGTAEGYEAERVIAIRLYIVPQRVTTSDVHVMRQV